MYQTEMSSFISDRTGFSIYKNVNEDVERDYFIGLIEINAKALVDSDDEDENKSYMPFLKYLKMIKEYEDEQEYEIFKSKTNPAKNNRIDVQESELDINSSFDSVTSNSAGFKGKFRDRNITLF